MRCNAGYSIVFTLYGMYFHSLHMSLNHGLNNIFENREFVFILFFFSKPLDFIAEYSFANLMLVSGINFVLRTNHADEDAYL